MSEPIVLPALLAEQEAAWLALLELCERHPVNWALVGGQMVFLHCIERGSSMARPTKDADAVLDVRAEPGVLASFTASLRDLGFAPVTTGDGLQHRWTRGEAQIDVLIPDGVGENAASRVGVDGAPTLPAPGTTQALQRAEKVQVVVAGRSGAVLRPNLVGALIGKAAARIKIVNDQYGRARHCEDFVILCSLISARDFRDESGGMNPISSKQRKLMADMIEVCRADKSAQEMVGHAEHLDRLTRALAL